MKYFKCDNCNEPCFVIKKYTHTCYASDWEEITKEEFLKECE